MRCNCENTHCPANHARGSTWRGCAQPANDKCQIQMLGHVCTQCYAGYPAQYRIKRNPLSAPAQTAIIIGGAALALAAVIALVVRKSKDASTLAATPTAAVPAQSAQPTTSNSDVRSPTSSDVRSPTSTSTEVRSPTSTSTEVRSPTSTSTDAYTQGNITITGGAGAGATTSVTVNQPAHPTAPQARNTSIPRVERATDGKMMDMVMAPTTPPSATRATGGPSLDAVMAPSHKPPWPPPFVSAK